MNVVKPDLRFLERLADAAAEETLKYFRSNMDVENKFSVGFDPVTEGDRRAEAAIRSIIEDTFPDHGILGEEFGAKDLNAQNVWVIDPIDGTRAFISGVPVWGTLVGLKHDGVATMGFMHQPYTGEFFVADGEQSQLIMNKGVSRTLRTSRTRELSDAVLFTTSPFLFENEGRSRYDKLEASVKLARYGVDCYGGAMVAAGFADIFIEAGLQPYDIVALIPLIEQAGGIVTTVEGNRAEAGGIVIAASTASLHAQAIDAYWGSTS